MRTAILLSALLALASATGCKHMPGGGPLRQDWMDFIKRDRSWLIYNYDEPHRYCYQSTAWSPMVPSGCGVWCPALGAEPCLLPPVGPLGEVIQPGTAEPDSGPPAELPPANEELQPQHPDGAAPPPAAEPPGEDELFMDPAPPLEGQGSSFSPSAYEEPSHNNSTLRIMPAYFAQPIEDEPRYSILRLPHVSSTQP
jgi:hypothetical protein